MDGVPVTARPTPTGASAIDVPAGEHTIVARFGSTPPRIAGLVIAALTLLGVVALLVTPQERQKDRTAAG